MNFKKISHHTLDQLEVLLGELSFNDFVLQIPILNGATIGQHIRHTLEFFKCLIDGVTLGVVNYDTRSHDSSMETDSSLARQCIIEIKESILVLNEKEPFRLEVNCDINDEKSTTIFTNLARELVYNIDHMIHHMAIIKIGVQHIRPDIVLPRDFGVGVSTIKYQKSQKIIA